MQLTESKNVGIRITFQSNTPDEKTGKRRYRDLQKKAIVLYVSSADAVEEAVEDLRKMIREAVAGGKKWRKNM